MSKKVLSILLAVVMLLAITPVSVIAENGEDDILSYLTYYEINNGEVTITDCDTSISGDVLIPDTIAGYPVTAIGKGAFKNCWYIESIVIPDTVIEMGSEVFYYCINLKDVTFSKGMTYVPTSCFFCCHALENIIIPDSVIIIREEAFQNCYSLKVVEIPDSVQEIYDYAFCLCVSLESITIPKNVTVIRTGTFYMCISLKNVEISENVTDICAEAFSKCLSLESIVLPDNVDIVEAYYGDRISEGNFAPAFLDCVSLKDVYVYNPEIQIREKSIGFTNYKIPCNIDELIEYYKRYFVLSSYLSNGIYFDSYEEMEAECKELEQKISEYVEIDSSNNAVIDSLRLHGYKGSNAESYALANGFAFVEITDEEATTTEITTSETTTSEISTEESTTAQTTTDNEDDSPSNGIIDRLVPSSTELLSFSTTSIHQF